MTRFVLLKNEKHFAGFEASGHSTQNADDLQGKLVCSAVSSAVIMTANAITEILEKKAKTKVFDGYLKIEIENPDEQSDLVLKSLLFHINELSKEYSGRIEITNGGLH
ncbi:MAG: ribosomal-processing cysteine protease Prp [Clostridia bacterium]|nr:ribosomal-processing cysteine protease Prp [Clostridia bacterium]